jgi:hypothetical protein
MELQPQLLERGAPAMRLEADPGRRLQEDHFRQAAFGRDLVNAEIVVGRVAPAAKDVKPVPMSRRFDPRSCATFSGARSSLPRQLLLVIFTTFYVVNHNLQDHLV